MSRHLPILLVFLFALSACGGASTVTDVLGSIPPIGGEDPTPEPEPTPEPPPSGSSMSAAEYAMAQEVLLLVNAERATVGLPALQWHDEATEVAWAHSVDMDVRDFFDHENPDGELPWDRLTAAGVSYRSAGENIAWGYSSPDSVMTAWMNSDGHRANILRDGYTHIGIGVHSNGSIWWTQVFLTPSP